MAFRDSWHSALVYFGLAEERHHDDEYDDDYAEPEQQLEERYRERPNVRRMPSRRRGSDFDDIFAEDDGPRTTRLRAAPAGNGRSGGDVRVHLVIPKSFN